MKKLIAFDLDGTLTQHKTPIGDVNRCIMEELSAKYKLLMLGAGACERIYNQLRQLPIEIVGSYGMQHSVVEDGVFKIVSTYSYEVDRNFFETTVSELRKKFGFEQYYGNSVEYHPSGLVTFPVLGTSAPLDKKLAYDPDRKKRRAIYGEVKAAMPDYNVFIGGSSSFDITKGNFNKFYALKNFCDENGYSLNDALFIGDDFGEGGNDSHIRINGVDYIEIDDYNNFPNKVNFLL